MELEEVSRYIKLSQFGTGVLASTAVARSYEYCSKCHDSEKMDAGAKKSEIEERALELELEAGMKLSEAATLRLEHLSETDVRHHEPLDELLPSSSVRPCSAADIWSSPSRGLQPLAPPALHSATTPSAGQSRTDLNWLPRAEFRANWPEIITAAKAQHVYQNQK